MANRMEDAYSNRGYVNPKRFCEFFMRKHKDAFNILGGHSATYKFNRSKEDIIAGWLQYTFVNRTSTNTRHYTALSHTQFRTDKRGCPCYDRESSYIVTYHGYVNAITEAINICTTIDDPRLSTITSVDLPNGDTINIPAWVIDGIPGGKRPTKVLPRDANVFQRHAVQLLSEYASIIRKIKDIGDVELVISADPVSFFDLADYHCDENSCYASGNCSEHSPLAIASTEDTVVYQVVSGGKVVGRAWGAIREDHAIVTNVYPNLQGLWYCLSRYVIKEGIRDALGFNTLNYASIDCTGYKAYLNNDEYCLLAGEADHGSRSLTVDGESLEDWGAENVNGVWSDYYKEEIDEDSAVWSEEFNSYIDVEESVITSCRDYIPQEEAVLAYDNEYILREDAVLLYNGKYASPDDDCLYCSRDGDYFVIE